MNHDGKVDIGPFASPKGVIGHTCLGDIDDDGVLAASLQSRRLDRCDSLAWPYGPGASGSTSFTQASALGTLG